MIGGRCAGSTLANWLARAGVSVAVADRSTFPSDTLSTHVFQGGAIAALRRLGLLDDVLATGAPPVSRGRFAFRNGDDVVEAELPTPASTSPARCRRRPTTRRSAPTSRPAGSARSPGCHASASWSRRDGASASRGLRPVDTFLRRPTGPGWALIGDSGHFKDPSPGQGIADAMRQAERLAETIATGLGDGGLDRRLSDWGRWRDRDAFDRHEWAHTFGAAGPPPHVLVQVQRDALRRPDAAERIWGPSLQRMSPRVTLSPAVLGRAAVRAVAGRQLGPSDALGELMQLVRRRIAYGQARRRRHPTFGATRAAT